MSVSIVHCKKHPYDVYIGRGSKWGGDVLKELVEKHVQMYEDHGLSQDYFCRICGNLVDSYASCGRIYCSNGHNSA